MDQIGSMLQRPLHYNNIDGLGEVGLGFFGLGCGLLDWLRVNNPASAALKGPMRLVWFWLIIGVIYYGTKAIKQHITYPRTGFVEHRRRKNASLTALVLGGATALLAAVSLRFAARSHWNIYNSHLGLTTPIALVGLLFVAMYVWRIAIASHWKLAIAAALAICSIVIAMLPADMVGQVAGNASAASTPADRSLGAWMLTLMLYGALLLISGAVSFVLYLRHTPPLAQAVE